MPTGPGSRPTFSCSHPGSSRKIQLKESGGKSAHCFLHERADPCLVGGGQLLQREGGRPHVTLVKGRLVAEAERCVPRLELLRVLEEADDVAVLGIRRHPVPESRRELWCACLDQGMEP